jgi:hypothetical protein
MIRSGDLRVARLNAKIVRIRLSDILQYEQQALSREPTADQMQKIAAMHVKLAANRAAKKAAQEVASD